MGRAMKIDPTEAACQSNSGRGFLEPPRLEHVSSELGGAALLVLTALVLWCLGGADSWCYITMLHWVGLMWQRRCGGSM